MTFTNIFVQAGWNQWYRVRYFAYTSSGNQRQKCSLKINFLVEHIQRKLNRQFPL